MVLGYIGIDHLAPYVILQPHRHLPEEHPDWYPQGYLPEDNGLKAAALTIITRDSVPLEGYYIPTHLDSTRGCFILLHGIGAAKEQWYNLTKTLNAHSFDVFIYDSRAHGKSGGEYATYGFYEKQDVSDILDELTERFHPPKFGIWGNSYGAAVTLQAMANDERLTLGITESGFARLDDIVYDYKKRMLGFGIRWISDRVLRRAGEIAHFNPDEVQPVEAAKLITAPVFIGHGDHDENINHQYGVEIFRNLATTHKELYIVEGAGHNNMQRTGGPQYMEAIMQFIDANW